MQDAKQPERREVDDVLNQCSEAIDSGASKWPGMSYEQGVQAAVDWLLNGAPNPMSDG